ncbi:MAG: hypothetical protein BWK80_45360 [Desulfobacteraceae bacterium IS3]|nr:MAG: hypothetical protein BWK80_45360 [Desulfobacteraceae bacterium IS3]
MKSSIKDNAEGKIQKNNRMLLTLAAILAFLWLLGLVSSYTMGGFIHTLLVVAVIVVLINTVRGRRAA